MEQINQALKQAIDNLKIDNLDVTKKQIEIIKQELMKEEQKDVINKLIILSKEGKTNGK